MNLLKNINERVLIIGASLLILIIVFLPFVVATSYNFPQADDFKYTWLLPDHGVGGVVAFNYLEWSGRYSATLINALLFDSVNFANGDVASSVHWFPIVAMLSALLSCFLALKMFISGEKNSRVFLLAVLVFYAFIQQMPSVAQGVFWVVSTAAYTFSIATLVLSFFLLFNTGLNLQNLRKDWWLWIGIILSVAWTIGSNEMYFVIYMAAIGVIGLAILLRNGNKTLLYGLGLFAVIVIIPTLITFLSPGNHHRAGQSSGLDMAKLTLIGVTTGKVAVSHFWKWFADSPLLLFLATSALAFGSFFKPENGAAKWSFLKIRWYEMLLLTVIGSVAIMAIPILLSALPPPARYMNCVYFIFLIGIMATFILLMRQHQDKIKPVMGKGVALVLLCAISLLFAKNSDRRQGTIGYAYSEWLSGDFNTFHKESHERQQFVLDCPSDTCFVAPLTVYPATIYATDFSEIKTLSLYDSLGGYSFNDFYALSLGKKAVFLKEE